MDICPRLSPGQFIVLAAAEAFPVLIEEHRVGLYYDGLAIAETRTRNVEVYVAEIVREFFGRDALQVLPAATTEALVFYVEHYDGRLSEQVKQLAAIMLLGGQFNSFDDSHGQPARLPSPPPAPPSPVGATFQPILAGVPS